MSTSVHCQFSLPGDTRQLLRFCHLMPLKYRPSPRSECAFPMCTVRLNEHHGDTEDTSQSFPCWSPHTPYSCFSVASAICRSRFHTPSWLADFVFLSLAPALSTRSGIARCSLKVYQKMGCALKCVAKCSNVPEQELFL